MSKRTLFIGDVHGCYDELMELIAKVWLRDEDDLYFVWDLINKWPKSLEVVEWIRSRPNTWSVIGNHEYFLMMTDAEWEHMLETHPDMSEWRKAWINSGRARTDMMAEIFAREDLRAWLISLPFFIEKESFIVLHAGIHPDFWLQSSPEIMTMIREYDEKPWYEYYAGTKPIIYGHWAVDGLRLRKNTIGLDTGCCFWGHLTCYCLETGEIWQIKAHNAYKLIPIWKDKLMHKV